MADSTGSLAKAIPPRAKFRASVNGRATTKDGILNINNGRNKCPDFIAGIINGTKNSAKKS